MSPKAREDKRISRLHQMEMMEAAARGTTPTMQLDTTDFTSLPGLPTQQQPSISAPPVSLSSSRTAIVADDFLSSLNPSSSTSPSSGRSKPKSRSSRSRSPSRPKSMSARSQSTGSTSPSSNFFSQREKYEVDQSINLMDASSKRYSIEDSESQVKRGKKNTTSFVDIFLGGNGSTSGSSSPSSGGRRTSGIKTSWKTSMMGRLFVAVVFLAFMALLTLSVSFFVNDDGAVEENKGKTQLIRTAAPVVEEVSVEATRDHSSANFETNNAGSGPATFAKFDYGTKVEDTARFDDLKYILLQGGGTTAARLTDETTSAFHALRWLTDDDPLHLEPNNPTLKTRFALASLFYATHVPAGAATSTQRQALDGKAASSAGSTSTQWKRENEWMTESNVCEWYGVDCETVEEESKEPASVVHLKIASNGLHGTIPLELQLLGELVLLDLSGNALSGTIPVQLSSLQQIKYLLLHKNSLEGIIPPGLHQMTNAFEIYLSNNQLTGPLPDSFKNLDNLRALYVESNRLTGDIEHIGDMEGINHLHLSDNAFVGSLPSTIGRLSMLNDLRVANNKLTGNLPSEMASNTRLRLLYLANNNLNGQIPEMFEDLNKLTDLQLHGNGIKSKLPTSMGALTSLRRLTLEGNVMTGRLPSEWGAMTDLEALELFHNEIVGSIPTEFGEMSSLRDVSLGHNFIQGEIPSELGQLTLLKHLGLQHSAIKGAVPSELGLLTALVKLELGKTLVTGVVPDEICELNTLDVFVADCIGGIECSCCSACM